jgi:cobalamin-dependent methionine synthase I
VFAVEAIDRRSVRLRARSGVIEFRGAIGEFLGPVGSVAAFIATAGGELERRASDALKRGDHLTGLVYNAVGSERAEAAAATVLEELRDQLADRGLAPTLPYSPGYCGMALSEQQNLFALFDGETVGVTLSKSLLMQPIKSISGLIGVGPAADVRQHGSPCDRCELWTCQMRRSSNVTGE